MVIYGGVDIKEQKAALKAKPPHVVVATPGRVKAVRTREPLAACRPALTALRTRSSSRMGT